MNIHIITDLLRLGGISVDYPAQCPSSSRDTQSRVSRPIPRLFFRSPKRRSHSLGAAYVSAPLLAQQRSAPGVQRESPVLRFVPTDSCPGTEHWRAWFCLLCTLPSGICGNYWEASLSFLVSKLNSSSYLCLSSYKMFISHLSALFLYPPVWLYLVLGSPQLGNSTPDVVSSGLSRGEGSPPLSYWQYFN